MSQRIAIRLLAAIVLVTATAAAAPAQEFPTRPIRIMVGFSPGGSNDLISRILATKLTERLGRQVLVENRAGASGMVASEVVANAPPDGHLLMLASVAHTANPSLYKLKYDTEKAFVPITQIGAGSSVIVVHPSVQANTMPELLALVRNSPGKLHMAHAGVGTYQHMSASLLLNMAKLDVVLVPFKGGGPAQIDVLAGHSQILLVTHAGVAGHIRNGKLRLLAVSSTQRLDSLPNIPTISESGVPGYTSYNWWGIVGPAGVPKPIVDKLIAEIAAVQDARELQETLEKEGARVVKRSGAEFGKYISDEIAKWAMVVKEGKIKVD